MVEQLVSIKFWDVKVWDFCNRPLGSLLNFTVEVPLGGGTGQHVCKQVQEVFGQSSGRLRYRYQVADFEPHAVGYSDSGECRLEGK